MDTCKSKKCTDNLANVYKNIDMHNYAELEKTSFAEGKLTYEEINSSSNIISFLESDKCKSLHISNATSNFSFNKNKKKYLLISGFLMTLLFNIF